MAEAQEFLKSAFISEAEELLARMEDGLLALETRPDDSDVLNGIFRAGHTLKGSAGLLSIEPVVAFTHVLENVLDRLRKQEVLVDQRLITLLLGGRDVLQNLVKLVADDRAVVTDEHYQQVLTSLQSFADAKLGSARSAKTSAEAAEEKRERVFRIGFHPRTDLFETGQDPLMLLLELSDLGELLEVLSDVTMLPSFSELEVQKLYLSWRILLRTGATRRAVEDVFAFVRTNSRVEFAEVMDCRHFVANRQPIPTATDD